MTIRIPRAIAGRRRAARTSARALGLFSIGLGLAEIFAPRLLGRMIGLRGSEGTLVLYGMREVATGIGILASGNPAPWIWGRVAGDALDLASLGAGMAKSESKACTLGGIAAVAGVTFADYATATILDELNEKDRRKYRDYSDRSGFPKQVSRVRAGTSPALNPQQPQPGVRV